ncbi:hypothetical protein G6F68_020919 [Rhizopus microsporus]|nr:hypothetical protein G6F68_020919 [Rhizopus microsporus]
MGGAKAPAGLDELDRRGAGFHGTAPAGRPRSGFAHLQPRRGRHPGRRGGDRRRDHPDRHVRQARGQPPRDRGAVVDRRLGVVCADAVRLSS